MALLRTLAAFCEVEEGYSEDASKVARERLTAEFITLETYSFGRLSTLPNRVPTGVEGEVRSLSTVPLLSGSDELGDEGTVGAFVRLARVAKLEADVIVLSASSFFKDDEYIIVV